MANKHIKGLMICGLAGDSGKTIVSCGLLANLRKRLCKLGVFKKGPDYIDPAWLKLASGEDCRNLDVYMMGEEAVKFSFSKHAQGKDLIVVEGNRGLYDGLDLTGSYSSAELAKLLNIPVVIVLNVSKMTRTAAALVLGCKMMDPALTIAGIVINQVAGKRHEKIIRESIEKITNIPVLGAIPKIKNKELLPSRHLGLVTPIEYEDAGQSMNNLADIIDEYVDIDRLLEQIGTFEHVAVSAKIVPSSKGKQVKLAYFSDKAFSFYYKENLEALEQAGAELIAVSSLDDKQLPEVDGLYIGGGFPETNIEMISKNKSMLRSVNEQAEMGLPIYAECGGLMYLCRSIDYLGLRFELSNVFPYDIEMHLKPVAHGYAEMTVDKDNPFFETYTDIKGHEFHYSRLVNIEENNTTCLNVKRGKGIVKNRDGLVFNNTFASYLHIHALSAQNWAGNFVSLCKKHKANKYSNTLEKDILRR